MMVLGSRLSIWCFLFLFVGTFHHNNNGFNNNNNNMIVSAAKQEEPQEEEQEQQVEEQQEEEQISLDDIRHECNPGEHNICKDRSKKKKKKEKKDNNNEDDNDNDTDDCIELDHAPDKFYVSFKTTVNNDPIMIEIHREWSPIGVDRFYKLILDNYFNCGTFFRVVPNFVIQFGIASNPLLTKKWDININDDTNDNSGTKLISNKRGTLSFATAGPNTRTTQIFINLQDNIRLDDMGFTPIGKVIEGMDTIVTNISNPTPNDSGGINQNKLENFGNDWVLKEYPTIDIITHSAHVIPDE